MATVVIDYRSCLASDDLKQRGFDCEELDLRLYFGDFDGLCDRLTRYDLLWVVGGNAFVLAKAMTVSRFAGAVEGLIADERLVYAGYSAGTCATAPDLEGIQLMDDPALLPDGYPASVTATTLAWVPWRIVPHWQSDHPRRGTPTWPLSTCSRGTSPLGRFETARPSSSKAVARASSERRFRPPRSSRAEPC